VTAKPVTAKGPDDAATSAVAWNGAIGLVIRNPPVPLADQQSRRAC